MVPIDPIDQLMRAALISDEEFVTALNDLPRHDILTNIRELAGISVVAQSSFYTIMHGRKTPDLSTLRAPSSVPYASSITLAQRTSSV